MLRAKSFPRSQYQYLEILVVIRPEEAQISIFKTVTWSHIYQKVVWFKAEILSQSVMILPSSVYIGLLKGEIAILSETWTQNVNPLRWHAVWLQFDTWELFAVCHKLGKFNNHRVVIVKRKNASLNENMDLINTKS